MAGRGIKYHFSSFTREDTSSLPVFQRLGQLINYAYKRRYSVNITSCFAHVYNPVYLQPARTYSEPMTAELAIAYSRHNHVYKLLSMVSKSCHCDLNGWMRGPGRCYLFGFPDKKITWYPNRPLAN